MNFHDAAFESRFDADDLAAAWGEPDLTLLGTNRRPAPDFPVQLLGPFWADWAKRSAEAASAPIDYPASALLAAVGATIANVRWPVAGPDWQEPPLLWLGLVGSPSSGKTPGTKSAFDLIAYTEDQLAAGFDECRRDHDAKRYVAESHLKAWKGETDAAVKAGQSAPPKPAAAEEPEAPVRPRIRAMDATTEKLGTLAAALPRGLLLGRDELAGWVASFDRYGGSGGDRTFYLEAYGGGPYRIDRMKHPEPVNIRHLSVGVLGTTQPDRLAAITGGADDGLASRVLWSWPDKHPPFRLPASSLDTTAAKFAFNRLAGLPLGSDVHGNPEPVRLRLTAGSNAIIEAFGQDMAERAGDATGPYAGALGKARGHVLRLATILEFLWWCGAGDQREPSAIMENAVTAACGLVDGYFVPMAERVYGDASLPPAERAAMTLAKHLRTKKLAAFNARQLGRAIGSDLRDSETMTAACMLLVEANLICAETPPAGRGRRPKDYRVNPVVFARA